MDWLGQMNSAIEYIEGNLDGSIEYSVAAQKACCSVYHFQRMFSYMAGLPLSEYIRHRRLALAAADLQDPNEKVIGIALRYGYDSPTAFTRAFRAMHGISPSEARENGVPLKAFPPVSFQITIKGAVEMEYRIEQKEAFRIVGAKLHTTIENGESYRSIPAFWGSALQSGKIAQIASVMEGEPKAMLGVSACNAAAIHSEFEYYIAAVSGAPVPEGLEEFVVPACTWAIFSCAGMGNVQMLQKRIVTEWLPTSGYEYADAPDVEVYFDEDMSKPEARFEVWLPIKKTLKLPVAQ